MKYLFCGSILLLILAGPARCQNDDKQNTNKGATEWLFSSNNSEIVVGNSLARIQSEAILGAITDLSQKIEIHMESSIEQNDNHTPEAQVEKSTSITSALVVGDLKISYFAKNFEQYNGENISKSHFEMAREIIFARKEKGGIIKSFHSENEKGEREDSFTMTFRDSDINDILKELEAYFFLVSTFEEGELYFAKITVNEKHYDSIIRHLKDGGKINREFIEGNKLYREFLKNRVSPLAK